MKKVCFIGFGEIGGALASLMQGNAQVVAWDKDPAKVMGGVGSLQEAVTEAEVVFLCVPSWVIRSVAEEMRSWVTPTTIVISLAKGLEADSFKTMDVVLREVFGDEQPVGVMGGPLLAEELEKGLPGVGVIGVQHTEVESVIRSLFAGSRLRLEMEKDATAVALASVLKNIYAVGLGIAEGLGWGWNGKGWLAAHAFEEMKRIAHQLEVSEIVISGPAGAGDFLATALSDDSFNRETGRQIALTGECKTLSEGCRSIPSILHLLGHHTLSLPFLYALDQIIHQQEAPRPVFDALLTDS